MGFKDYKNPYFSGYFYLPYLPFDPIPDSWTENTHQHNYMRSRYDKKLIDKDFYGLLKVSGLPKKEQKVEEKAEDKIIEEKGDSDGLRSDL